MRSIRQEVAPSLHFDERFILVATGLANVRGEGKVMLTFKLIMPRSVRGDGQSFEVDEFVIFVGKVERRDGISLSYHLCLVDRVYEGVLTDHEPGGK